MREGKMRKTERKKTKRQKIAGATRLVLRSGSKVLISFNLGLN